MHRPTPRFYTRGGAQATHMAHAPVHKLAFRHPEASVMSTNEHEKPAKIRSLRRLFGAKPSGRSLNRRLADAAVRMELAQREHEELMIERSVKSSCMLLYPMCVLPFSDLKREGRLRPHEHMRAKLQFVDTYPELVQFAKSSPSLFLSHQWLGVKAPDPNGVHYAAAIAAAEAVCHREQVSEEELFIWFDYFSIPQKNVTQQALAVSSLAVYASACSNFVAIVPETTHGDAVGADGAPVACDRTTYMRRGWCRLENLAFMTVNQMSSMFIFDGNELTSMIHYLGGRAYDRSKRSASSRSGDSFDEGGSMSSDPCEPLPASSAATSHSAPGAAGPSQPVHSTGSAHFHLSDAMCDERFPVPPKKLRQSGASNVRVRRPPGEHAHDDLRATMAEANEPWSDESASRLRQLVHVFDGDFSVQADRERLAPVMLGMWAVALQADHGVGSRHGHGSRHDHGPRQDGSTPTDTDQRGALLSSLSLPPRGVSTCAQDGSECRSSGDSVSCSSSPVVERTRPGRVSIFDSRFKAHFGLRQSKASDSPTDMLHAARRGRATSLFDVLCTFKSSVFPAEFFGQTVQRLETKFKENPDWMTRLVGQDTGSSVVEMKLVRSRSVLDASADPDARPSETKTWSSTPPKRLTHANSFKADHLLDGQRVYHEKHGIGTILKVQPGKRVVKFDRPSSGTHTYTQHSFAKLLPRDRAPLDADTGQPSEREASVGLDSVALTMNRAKRWRKRSSHPTIEDAGSPP